MTTKLKLSTIEDDTPIKLSLELPAALHRDLAAYAQLLSGERERPVEPVKLIAPMLQRFMATDRVFARRRRT